MPNKNNVILSSYYVTKPDPQRGYHWPGNDFGIIKEWYDSVIKNDLYAIVFHDHLTSNFIEAHECDNVKFVYSGLTTRLSCNDERFVVFCEYLTRLDFDNVLITDISDVVFNKDPFEFMTDKTKLYVGSNDTWRAKQSVRKRYPYLLHEQYDDMPIFHAGTWGGNDYLVHSVLTWLPGTLDWRRGYNQNLGRFNELMYEHWTNGSIVTGYPFTTQFKKYEKDSNAYIRHK